MYKAKLSLSVGYLVAQGVVDRDGLAQSLAPLAIQHAEVADKLVHAAVLPILDIEAVDMQHVARAPWRPRDRAPGRQRLRKDEVPSLRHHHCPLQPGQAPVRHPCTSTCHVSNWQ